MADERTAVDPPRAGTLPTGTVTFLFTDIEGSTRLLRADPPGYAASLAVHRRLLRDAFAAHGGQEVDTQGDSFFVAFPSAGQALAAAAEAQQSLAGHAWPEGRDVRVRMGLHTGDAAVTGGGYVALPVHQAARIAAAAHGGQILLSDVTAVLAGEHLPQGTALRSLGPHRLKDFPGPVPLSQLDVTGLPREFPPLDSPPAQPRLPAPAEPLVGREAEVSALVALLRKESTRLVTVTGPGGVGKTRLALEAARQVAGDFRGGVVFVALSPVADPALVLSSVADAVGARREAAADLVEAVRTTIDGDRTLLVLDNFEQVTAAASDVATLLDRTPAIVAVVTSRQVLRLRSEQQFHLGPLPETPAMQLFAERATATRPDFVLDATTAPAVAEICRRLDGLPLAIELAAARVRLLPPDALLTRLRNRLDVLGDGPVDLPERQRTLRATMDWSHGLLQPHEQTLFARLGIFAGGWTLTAAETVCGRAGEPEVLGTLAVLLDDSLLVDVDGTAPEPRLDMLETVRAYAAEKLAASPDGAETGHRHAEWVLAMTDPLVHAEATAFRRALERFDQERANVRAAVQRAIDTGRLETAALLIRNALGYLVRRSGEREAVAWLEQALPRSTSAVRGRLLVLRALLAGVFVDLPAVRPLLDEGLDLLPDDDDHAYDRALAAMAGIYAAMAEGSVEKWAHGIEETAGRFAALGQDLGRAFMEVFGGELALMLGDLEAAEQHYGAALELAGRLGDESLTGQALSSRGLVLLARGDLAGARRSVMDGAAANRRGGQPTAIAYALEGLAAVALGDGRPDVAAQALAAATSMREHLALPRAPALPPLLDDVADRARRQLGDEAYDAAVAEARQWPSPQALDRTFEALTEGTT
ncbi:AAA family ATPase [Blastococcus sp. CT_GayMR16]|uniref:ATP-binding protein n=1 Tax=Blastococcus sp. CT_GayMR16 TaxID=2559607 RepID=UPI0010743431|nr:AAA family ATPase [Blastococcus sp. CT_GayMR16]TFV86981.1 adenylate/guanylate cyclase domain-containing protein [Blastococcus sp. CT_GayMR16]